MRVYKSVRSSAKEVPTIEVNLDTVYVRTNIVAIDQKETETTQEFKGFEYDEVQYTLKEYLETLTSTEELASVAGVVTMLMSKVMMLEMQLLALEPTEI